MHAISDLKKVRRPRSAIASRTLARPRRPKRRLDTRLDADNGKAPGLARACCVELQWEARNNKIVTSGIEGSSGDGAGKRLVLLDTVRLVRFVFSSTGFNHLHNPVATGNRARYRNR